MQNSDFHKIASYTNDMSELETYFYQMSHDMKELHKDGYRVTSFDPKEIKYNDGEFSFLKEEMYIDEEDKYIKDNIYNMAILFVNTYADKNHLFQPGFVLTKEYIRETLSGLEYIFSEQDASYFNSLFEGGYIDYYHDYVSKIDKDVASSMGQRKNYVKATAAGALFAESEDQLNKSAFISVPVVFIIAGALLLVMILIYTLFMV